MKLTLTLPTALLLTPLSALPAAETKAAGQSIERPAFHFTPPAGWMNDPNGLLHHEGEFHLFYQSFPEDIQRVIYGSEEGGRAGARIGWGHAVSRDLVAWEHLPLAIPEERGAEEMAAIYSGSAVVDYENRSGFGKGNRPPIGAFYTLMKFSRDPAAGEWRPTTQPVGLAYSNDGGRTFTKYEGNPVVDVGDRTFGDPKVFWHAASERWIMVNIWGNKQGKVGFWGSANLKDWKFLSEFHAEQDAPGKWECPDLFPLAVDGNPERIKWVLKVANRRKYFIGDFDGREFRREPSQESTFPYPQGSYYAEVTFNGIPDTDGRRVMMGWISKQTPRAERAWTGMQSVPRSLTLRTTPQGLRVCQEPVAELRKLRGAHQGWQDKILPAAESLTDLRLAGSLWELQAEFAPDSSAEFGFRFTLDSGRELKIGYDRVGQKVFCDQPTQPRASVPQPMRGDTVTFHLLVDHSVIEVFAEDGETAYVALIDPDASVTGIGLFAKGGSARAVSLDVWALGKEKPQ